MLSLEKRGMQQLRTDALEMVGATDRPIGDAQLSRLSSRRCRERWFARRGAGELDLEEVMHPNLRAGGGAAAHRHALFRIVNAAA